MTSLVRIDDGRVELDCLRVRTADELAAWAIVAFGLPVVVTDLPRVANGFLFGWPLAVDLGALTSCIYEHAAANRLSFTVVLKYRWARSHVLRSVLDGDEAWPYIFGFGLPHDHGVAIGFTE